MSFHDLELIFAHTWYCDIAGDLRLVGRLVARGWVGRGAQVELLEKHWDVENGQPSCSWRSHLLEPTVDQIARLVERVRAVWADGRAPRIAFQPTSNTAYDGLVLSVRLDGMGQALQAVPLDGISGPDGVAFCELLEAVADVTGPCRPLFPPPRLPNFPSADGTK